jgi:ATP-dependent Lon protease
VAQKSAAKDEPGVEDMYEIGCIANILQMLKLPDGTVKVLVEGVQRARIERIEDSAPVRRQVMPCRSTSARQRGRGHAPHGARPVRPVREAEQEDSAGDADLAGGHRGSRAPGRHHRRPPAAQARAEAGSARDVRCHRAASRSCSRQLETELDILQVEKRIRGRVKRQMEKSQREYYLNEQVKAIQKELGEGEEGADLDEMEKKIKAAGMSKEALAKAEGELKKLR